MILQMKPFKIHRPESFRILPWRNGLGSTIELLVENSTQQKAFSWRLSIATVATGGPFSDFSGYDRTLLLLEGAGITLNNPNGPCIELNSLLDCVHFKGEDLIDASLHDGPIKDFNVMTLRSICTSSVTVITKKSKTSLQINADKLLVYSIKPIKIQIGLEGIIELAANHLLQFSNSINDKITIDNTEAIVIQIYYNNQAH